VLFLEKRCITEPTTVVELTVDQRPDRAGIDPYTKLIDRNPADNVRRVLEAAGGAAPGSDGARRTAARSRIEEHACW